ncbi:hypothetical protein D3C78_1307970 [compost metagenome]
MGDGGLHRFVVRLAASPVALEFEQILQGGHRPGSQLDHPLHGALVGFVRDVAAGVGDHVDLEALIQGGQHRADDTHRGPQASENDLVLAELVDLDRNPLILPGVHGGAIDHVVIGKYRAYLVEDGT